VRSDGTVKVLDFGLAKALTPDWTAIPPGAPSYVLPLIQQCLQKATRNRLPHIGVALCNGTPLRADTPSGKV